MLSRKFICDEKIPKCDKPALSMCGDQESAIFFSLLSTFLHMALCRRQCCCWHAWLQYRQDKQAEHFLMKKIDVVNEKNLAAQDLPALLAPASAGKM